ncbi:nuclear transport factor 2 family protein [Flavobacterium jejuense]|uniref:Nuclear transport factor 2 family protein n=2 Tax=Flavobacterium jejuense TaxID=1544455 RepID=A0ABX0IVJ6_9FLAO|nr:nuclear transport factor 2 family protein [Flavobacterium jejuense]
MKKGVLYLFLLSINFLIGQEISPKKTIEDFFVAFHKKDTIVLRTISHKEIVLQTIAKTKEGNNKVLTENYTNFLKSIIAIPVEMKFEEKLLDYTVQIDGLLAHVWTPYEFYINDKLSHKGVNSFTLVKEADTWKIVHIIDTRHK